MNRVSTPPTLHDVARAADVSYATVDRVVNERGSVSIKTRTRVAVAIASLGYQRDVEASNLAKRRIYQFHLVIPSVGNSFFADLEKRFEYRASQLPHLRQTLTLHRFNAFDPVSMVGVLSGLDAAKVDALAVVSIDDDRVHEQLERLRGAGVKVLTLVSDAPPQARDLYVGIDNVMAGRMAARMVGLAHGRSGTGTILPILGSFAAADHASRFMGFQAVMAEHFGALTVLEAKACGDDPEKVVEVVRRAVSSEQNISGVYSIGSGNRLLFEWLAAQRQMRPAVVVHELTAKSRTALTGGAVDVVIDQNPDEIVGRTFAHLKQAADGAPIETQGPLQPKIFVRENV